MKLFEAKKPLSVYAEQVVFTQEEKEAVLHKQRVTKYGGEVKVTRPGTPDGEDAFHVGLSVNYNFVMVPEGDYLITDPGTGKQSVMSKESFEREFVIPGEPEAAAEAEQDAEPEAEEVEPKKGKKR